MTIVAWTGGSSPRPFAEVSTEEVILVIAIYRYHCDVYRDHWHEEPPSDLCEQFWTHARYDAHATLRGLAEAA